MSSDTPASLAEKARTLTEQFLSEEAEGPPPQELRDALAQLPPDQCLYEKGLVAYCDEKDDEALELLSRAAIEECGRWTAPVTYADFRKRWIEPFDLDPSPGLWSRLADAFAQRIPDTACCLVLRGFAASEAGDDQEAIQHFEKALDIDEACWDAAFKLANILLAEEDFEKASSYYDKALAFADDQGKCGLHWSLGNCRLVLGDTEGAIDHYTTVLQLNEEAWLAAAELGYIYFREKNWKAARAYFEQAARYVLESDNDYWDNAQKAVLFFDLGVACYKCRDYAAEEAAYRKCLEVDPNCKYARSNLAWSLASRGELEKAVRTFQDAIDRGNDGKFPVRGLARTLRKLRRYTEAIELLEQDIHRGKLTKYATSEIEELRALMQKQKEAGSPVEELPDENVREEEAVEEREDALAATDEFEEESVAPEPVSTRGKPENRKGKRLPKEEAPTRLYHESVLEELIERQIERGERIFGRRLRMFEAEDSKFGRYGRQFAIPGKGRLDLLTVDLDTGDLVVVELKVDKPTRETIGQLFEYIAWVQENLAEGRTVHGVICVREANEALRVAVSRSEGVELYEYELSFTKV